MDGSLSARLLWRLWLLVVGTFAIAILYLAKVLFLPLAFAILFAFLLAPVVSLLERIRAPRTLAALAVILAFAALLGAAGWGLFTQLVAIANDLPTYEENIQHKMAVIHQPTDSAYGRAEQEIEHLNDELGLVNSTPPQKLHPEDGKQKPIGTSPDRPVQVREVARPTGRLDHLGGVLEPITTALLSVVFTFFVLMQREDLRNRLIHLSGDRNLATITQAMDDANRRISRYFSLQLMVNLIYGSVVLGVLYAVGLPHPFLFAAVAAIFRFVPYIGWPIAAMFPTVLSIAVFHGWQKSLIIVGTFIVLEIVTANYAEPHIYGKHTGLSSLAVLMAAAFWTLIWGPVGLVLSVPLTVCLVVIGRHVPALEFLTVMLGDKSHIPDWMCFYQRLLAHDEQEATQIMESALKQKPLEEVYDSVLIPAIVMAEQDSQHSDLEESTERFIRQTSRELVEEFGFRENREVAWHGFESITPTQRSSPHAIKVMCVPVRDETDELAALMAAQVLEGMNIRSFALAATRVNEMVEAARAERPDLLVLCALPPVGLARCHRVYRSLRAHDPNLRIVIGIWNYPDNAAEGAKKISDGEETQIWTRLADVVAQIRGVAEPHAAEADTASRLADESAA
jgi:predicted PurR-regulated permease PerM